MSECKYQLSIRGMHCSSCAVNIEKILKKFNNVKTITVSAVTNKAFVTSEDKLDEAEVKKAISKLGYTVVSMEKL